MHSHRMDRGNPITGEETQKINSRNERFIETKIKIRKKSKNADITLCFICSSHLLVYVYEGRRYLMYDGNASASIKDSNFFFYEHLSFASFRMSVRMNISMIV